VLLDPPRDFLRGERVDQRQLGDVAPLRIVAIVIADGDVLSLGMQVCRDVGSDEAGATGDKDHRVAFAAGVAKRWTILVVLWPGVSSARKTRPPAAVTKSPPTTLSTV
jgi:hypothetical protein